MKLEMRRKRAVLLCWVLFLLALTETVLASHPLTIRIAADPAALPLVVDEEFNLEVYLSAAAQQDLWAAELRLAETAGNDHFNFVALASSATGSGVFPPLESNEPYNALQNWLMEGSSDGLTPFSLTAAETLLGKIRVKATAAGAVALSPLPSTKFVQAMEDPISGTEEHLFTATLVMDPITINPADVPSCTGAVPSNSQLCAGDEGGLPVNTPRTAVASCSDSSGPKCEYSCNSGFQPNQDGTDCELIPLVQSCGNNLKEGTEECDGTDFGGAGCASKLGAGYTGSLICADCMISTEGCIAPSFALTSPAIVNGEIIDNQYTCHAEPTVTTIGLSPRLVFSSLPSGTQSLALILDDPDVPAAISSTPFVHWLLFNLEPTPGLSTFIIPENDQTLGSKSLDTDFENLLYHGPCPPAGERHQYRFRAYALSAASLTVLDDGSGDPTDRKDELLQAMGVTDVQTSGFSPPVLGLATLTARYPPQTATCSDTYPSLCTTKAACTAANNFWDSTSLTCKNACPFGTNVVNKVCISSQCGDGNIDDGEQCDNGAENLDTWPCKSDCTNNICGDGFQLVGTEQCDDGNKANTDTCTNACKGNTCGDGFVNYGDDGLLGTADDKEACDDGNLVSNDGCSNSCQSEQCTQDTDCPAGNDCVASTCTDVLQQIRFVLENKDQSGNALIRTTLQKISAIAKLLRDYFT